MALELLQPSDRRGIQSQGSAARGCFAVALVALLSHAAACVDPRLPYVEEEAEVVNFPPSIDSNNVVPLPGTLPQTVLIGTNCIGDNTFSVGSVFDADLQVGERLTWRWRIAPDFATGSAIPPRTLREGTVLNTEEIGTIGASLPVGSFTIDEETLRGEFFNSVETMVGRTHRVEVYITDGTFEAGVDSVKVAELDAGIDYFYWFFQLENQPCI